MVKISGIHAIEILDSRGNPTIEATVITDSGASGVAMVPSGASTGTHEALELRDGDQSRFGGLGVLKAVANVEGSISQALLGMEVSDQEAIDRKMMEVDGTEHKESLGANAILAVSLATARAAAEVVQKPLYQYLREKFWSGETEYLMPVPMMNVLNGGKHAVGSVDLQEFMVMPIGANNFAEALRMSAEVYQKLKSIIHDKGLSVGVGDEGGFMPKMSSHEEVLQLLISAITGAGYKAGDQFAIALDPAASSFYKGEKYHLKTEGKVLSADEMIEMYKSWVNKYPIVSIEDGLFEDEWAGFTKMTSELGQAIQIVGDDLFVTNPTRLERGIKEKAANSVLVKLNQIGSLTETVMVIKMAMDAKMTAVVSHRSGETEDTFIADLVVAANAGQIKSGAPCRTERVAKYNRLLVIEKELQEKASFAQMPYKS
jgi:enolase